MPLSLQYHLPVAINFAGRHFLAWVAIFLTNWSECSSPLPVPAWGGDVSTLLQKALIMDVLLQTYHFLWVCVHKM